MIPGSKDNRSTDQVPNNKYSAIRYPITDMTPAITVAITLRRHKIFLFLKQNYLSKFNFTKKEVFSAEESLKISLIRMEIGEATFLDVLQAQQAKTEARQVLVQHIVDYNKSQIQTLFNIGLITKCAALTNYRMPK